jgi:hypothetical protein
MDESEGIALWRQVNEMVVAGGLRHFETVISINSNSPLGFQHDD